MPPEIAARWRARVRQHLWETQGEERDHLQAGDFPLGKSVRAVFPDGSHLLFRYAFFLTDAAAGEVAVFTEHCGYHYFPLADLQIEHVGEVSGGMDGDADEAAEPAPESVVSLLEQVRDQGTFLRFMHALAASQQGGGGDVEWASERAGDYLEAAAAWAVDARAVGGGLPVQPSWRAIAEFLYAGAIYE